MQDSDSQPSLVRGTISTKNLFKPTLICKSFEFMRTLLKILLEAAMFRQLRNPVSGSRQSILAHHFFAFYVRAPVAVEKGRTENSQKFSFQKCIFA